MATLNDTITNDEDYALALQAEEITFSERNRKKTLEPSNRVRFPNRAKSTSYVCIDDEIITITDDDDGNPNNRSFSLSEQFSNNYVDKDDLIRNDEQIALKLQEELDKEMAKSIEKRQRSKRREQQKPSEFLINRLESISPDFDIQRVQRNRNILPHRSDTILNHYSTRRSSNDTGFISSRRVNEAFNSNNYTTRNSRRNDLIQTNLTTRNGNLVNEVSIRGTDFNPLHTEFLHDISRSFERINDTNFSSSLNNLGLNLNNDIGIPNNRRLNNRRANHHNFISHFNANSHDFTPDDYEDLLRLDEMNTVKKGLKKEEFDSLPKFYYKPSESGELDSDYTCSICQDDFENRAMLTALACSHKFHRKCIKEWLIQSRRCPLCTKDAVTGN